MLSHTESLSLEQAFRAKNEKPEFGKRRTQFFLSPGRPKTKSTPLGGQQAKGAARGLILSPGRPKTKSTPLGGQQAKGAARGLILSPGRPKTKSTPLGGQQAKG
ncbi:MAG: hypothetical protein ACTJGJ_14200, partial [Alcaligenes aquatilis]